MPVPLDKFVKQLEDSGILAGDTIKEFIPPKASPKDGTELARELIRQKKLTKFQATEVSKGNGKFLVLGNYVLMDQIGAGGMGQVFKAEHRRMHRTVAVKMLPPKLTKDATAIARFEREVTAAAKLRHPNIVAADDADCANGVHFLVMEMVEGSDLSALVKKNGPFSVVKAVNYVLQAAKGLEFAHREGVVHRDIKPANLLLDRKETVKILDMGLARLNGDVDAPTQAELTSTGTVMGTVDYMAPEQALNTKTADARADIYALGCSLYYLLTGKAIYDGDTLMAKLLAHRDQPIPALRSIRPEISEQLDVVFRKLVAKKVEDRYQTMTEAIAELERCTVGPTTSTTIQQAATTTVEDGSFDFLQTLPDEPTRLAQVPKKLVSGLGRKDRNRLFYGGIGAAFLGLSILAGIIVSLRTKDGTLIVEVNQPDAMVQVLDAEGKVEISQKGGRETVFISVDPGKHRLKVEKEGFTIFGQDFEMKSGGRTPIKAKLVPLEENPAMAGNAPAPVVDGAKKPLFFQTPGFEPWAKGVAAMPAEQQIMAVSKKLMDLNPEFDGKVTGLDSVSSSPRIENGSVTEFGFDTDHISDISPVRALSNLNCLNCSSIGLAGDIADLTPLQGMKLSVLLFKDTQVSDLSPLRGMPLIWLYCPLTMVSDLSPLSDCKSLANLNVQRTKVSDLSLLKEMPLRILSLDFKPERDTELLQSIKTLETINEKPAAEFWKEVKEQQRVMNQ
jgi:serine/threonine protein kinase